MVKYFMRICSEEIEENESHVYNCAKPKLRNQTEFRVLRFTTFTIIFSFSIFNFLLNQKRKTV